MYSHARKWLLLIKTPNLKRLIEDIIIPLYDNDKVYVFLLKNTQWMYVCILERYVILMHVKRSNCYYHHYLQCDVRKCPVCRFGLTCTQYKFDSCDHIGMMTQYVLIPLIRDVVSKFPNWLPEQHIQGTLDTTSKVS